jgi:hypothetical protein
MELKSFMSILSYLSDTPTTTVGDGSVEVEKEVNEVEETSRRKSITNSIDAKSKEYRFIDSDLESIEEEEEMSVERAFAELAGRRKTVTFESLVGWDVVAELLQDGALNTDVSTAVECTYFYSELHPLSSCISSISATALDILCFFHRFFSHHYYYYFYIFFLSLTPSILSLGPEGAVHAGRRQEESVRWRRHCAPESQGLRGTAQPSR